MDVKVTVQEMAEEIESPGRTEEVEAMAAVGEVPHRPTPPRGTSARPTTTWGKYSTTRSPFPSRTSSLEAREADVGA